MTMPIYQYQVYTSCMPRPRPIDHVNVYIAHHYLLTTDLATTIALRESLRREQK